MTKRILLVIAALMMGLGASAGHVALAAGHHDGPQCFEHDPECQEGPEEGNPNGGGGNGGGGPNNGPQCFNWDPDCDKDEDVIIMCSPECPPPGGGNGGGGNGGGGNGGGGNGGGGNPGGGNPGGGTKTYGGDVVVANPTFTG